VPWPVIRQPTCYYLPFHRQPMPDITLPPFWLCQACHPTSQAAMHHPVMTLVVRFAPSSLKLKTLWFAQFPSMKFSLALLLFLSPLVLHGYKPNKNVRTYAVPTLISSWVPVHQRSPPTLKMSSTISMLLSLSRDGLVVVRQEDPLSPSRKCIIVPRPVIDGPAYGTPCQT
jgi:hypothetical protein